MSKTNEQRLSSIEANIRQLLENEAKSSRQRRRRRLFMACAVAVVGLAWAVPAQTQVPHLFAAGGTARATDVNANFAALVADIDALRTDIVAIVVALATKVTWPEHDGDLTIDGSDNDGTVAALSLVSGTQVLRLDGNEIDSNRDLVLNGNSGNDVIFTVPYHGALQSESDRGAEAFRISGSPPFVCNASTRGRIYVARPSGAAQQDALCYCAQYEGGAFDHWCFNP